MKVDNVISLEDGKNYLLLLESELNESKYFLSVEVDKEENPTNNYIVLKLLLKDGEEYIIEEKDPFVLDYLLTDFNIQNDTNNVE